MKFDGFTKLYKEALEQGDRKPVDDLEPLPEFEVFADVTASEFNGSTLHSHRRVIPRRVWSKSLRNRIGRPSTGRIDHFGASK